MINGKQSFHFHDSRKYNTPTNRKRDGIGAGGGGGGICYAFYPIVVVLKHLYLHVPVIREFKLS